jgi:alkylation response protein AidB-like acyl-CoA dehydrogenase
MFAADVAMLVTTDALQIAGGYGYMTEYPFEMMGTSLLSFPNFNRIVNLFFHVNQRNNTGFSQGGLEDLL